LTRDARRSRDPALATWLVKHRRDVDQALAAAAPGEAPATGSPEAEALRRFRSFAASALLRGERAEPALDGLRVEEARLAQLLRTWCGAAADLAGTARGPAVRRALEPLAMHFCTSLRSSPAARRRRGAPHTGRRAVRAAIDRIADAFLAVDPDTGRIADANPAAGALLGLARDALLGRPVSAFVPEPDAGAWSARLDAVTESGETVRFRAGLRDGAGLRIAVDVQVTRHVTRQRVLALVVARPDDAAPAGPR